jgi:Mannosyltransferase putative
VVIDKSRNLAGVLLACHLNTLTVRNEITYQKFYGDKESYWFAHALTSTPYHFVPLYSGGIGPVTPAPQRNTEEICTLQLLHTLESTGEPLWLNNGLVEWKGADNDRFVRIEGWVPQGGRWRHSGDPRIPNLFCVRMPEAETEGLLGPTEKVNRVEGELRERVDEMIEAARLFDGLMEEAGLISIQHT